MEIYLFYSCYSLYPLLHYVCPAEIGKDFAISHAPPNRIVDVQCSIALLNIYIYIISLGMKKHEFLPTAMSIVLYFQQCSRIGKINLMCL